MNWKEETFAPVILVATVDLVKKVLTVQVSSVFAEPDTEEIIANPSLTLVGQILVCMEVFALEKNLGMYYLLLYIS